MPRDAKYDVLFEPVTIGPRTLKNRFYQTAHSNMAGTDHPGFQAHYRAMRAEGGWAAVSTEATSIGPESDTHLDGRLWDDGDVRNLSLMCDMVHEHGALAAVELWHSGHNAFGKAPRTVARGVSQLAMFPLAGADFGRSCKEMTKQDIREVQELYAQAAKRGVAAGFDIITIFMTHGDGLPLHFLLPHFNRRSDEYGGTFVNRARFPREVIERVREAVDGKCALSVRFSPDTLDPPHGLGDRGIRLHGDGGHFMQICDHLVDMWDINVSGLEWGEDIASSRTHKENHEAPYLDGIRAYTTKPIMNVGRFTNPNTMVEVINSGQADIIGAARPAISDPFLPRKIEEGRFDDIRECIGCNMCISRWASSSPIVCTQNATAAEEYRRRWHPEIFTTASNAENDVLIVGAGPAGMECARVLGERGFRRVHLVDSTSEMGGSVRWISQLPGLGEWARISNYRKVQIDKLANIEFVPNTSLTATDVLEYGAEIVIIATGASWATDGMNGITRDVIPGATRHPEVCLSPEQIMVEGRNIPGSRVMVYDCDGQFVGVGLAERLATEGHDVLFVTPFDAVAPSTYLTGEAPRINRMLRGLGVEIVTSHCLAEIQPTTVSIRDRWSTNVSREEQVNGVVLVTERRSSNLFSEIVSESDRLANEGITAVYEIGDCVAPQTLADAIFSGHRLAREIDSASPRMPLPFIRERRLWGQHSNTDFDTQLTAPMVSPLGPTH
jgi:dimethylamine/trimethylamine dehydrogenase